MSLKNWLATLGVVGGLTFGAYLVEKNITHTDYIGFGFRTAKQEISSLFLGDPTEEGCEFIASIKRNSEEIASGEYNIGIIVNEANQYRSPSELDREAADRISNSDSRVISYTLDNIPGEKRIGLAKYSVHLLDQNGKKEIAENTLDSITQDEKYSILASEASELPADKRQQMIMDLSNGFNQKEYETTIDSLADTSVALYDNKMILGKEILFGE